MRRTAKVVFKVQCAYDENHIFEKVLNIEESAEDEETEVQAYCPFCEKHVNVVVQGRVAPDAELLRKFGLE